MQIIDLLTLNETNLFNALRQILTKYYPQENITVSEDNYIFAESDFPVLLVAHLDTVFPNPSRADIYYDSKKHTYWSPTGLGADDRAGVYTILYLLEMGHRPSILFTMGEEIGGTGVCSFIEDFPLPPSSTHFILELDRQGRDEVVFYNCTNTRFQKTIKNFGFREEKGLFSDISILAPIWNIAAANLSVGYRFEHSYREFLNMNDLKSTLEKVDKILLSGSRFSFPFVYSDNCEMGICDYCKIIYPKQDLKKRLMLSGEIKNLCPNCFKELS